MSAISESEIRQEYSEVIVSTSSKSSKRMHLPSDNGKVEPRCDRALNGKSWRVKDLAVYPPGWHDFCQSCMDKVEEESPARGVYEGAMTSDWG